MVLPVAVSVIVSSVSPAADKVIASVSPETRVPEAVSSAEAAADSVFVLVPLAFRPWIFALTFEVDRVSTLISSPVEWVSTTLPSSAPIAAVTPVVADLALNASRRARRSVWLESVTLLKLVPFTFKSKFEAASAPQITALEIAVAETPVVEVAAFTASAVLFAVALAETVTSLEPREPETVKV
jgi:hypothetical protein